MPAKCFNIAALKAAISAYEHSHEIKPNGQSMYKFPNGLVLNIYDTGSCVFQGAEINGTIANQINTIISAINAPYSS